jgi:hypothetical protein
MTASQICRDEDGKRYFDLCYRCQGSGIDGIRFSETCYRCQGSGIDIDDLIDEEYLWEIARSVGFARAKEIRAGIEADLEGEGFAFHAAEHQLSSQDYFEAIAAREEMVAREQIAEMSVEDRRVLRAWHAYIEASKKKTISEVLRERKERNRG